MSYQSPSVKNFFVQHGARSIIMSFLVFGLLLVLTARMHYMQVDKYEHFKSESDGNRIQVKPLPPVRGKIYDREGRLLAGNKLTYEVGIIVEHTKGLSKVIKDIEGLIDINDKHLSRFKKNRRYTKAYDPVVLKNNLTETEVAKIEVNSPRLPGVVILANHNRVYYNPESFAHIIGYVGRINRKELEEIKVKEAKSNIKGNYRLTRRIGKLGIERYYEDVMHGVTGKRRVETDAQGRSIRTISVEESKSGKDIYLTIDASLQTYSHNLMQGRRGSIVAIDPKTFEIITMVSTPSYNPNYFVNGISTADYNVWRNSINKPLFNRSINGRYPPGSTIKPFLALAGLEHGVVKKNNTVFCKGYYKLKNSNHKFRDWKKHGHGTTNLIKGVAESCDVYFYDLSFKLGIDRINPFLKLFHFGKRTGIDFPFETNGFIPSRDWKIENRGKVWTPGDTLNTGIGQGLVQVSPLQLAYATAVLANKGVSSTPRLLLNNHILLADENSEVKVKLRKVPVKNSRNWRTIVASMKSVVHSRNGTAKLIKTKEYTIAGKTGTAQVVGIAQNKEYNEKELSERLHDHALFIAFAPIKKPKIAIAVIVENGKHGSSTAAPIAKKVMDRYLLGLLRGAVLENPEKEKPADAAIRHRDDINTINRSRKNLISSSIKKIKSKRSLKVKQKRPKYKKYNSKYRSKKTNKTKLNKKSTRKSVTKQKVRRVIKKVKRIKRVKRVKRVKRLNRAQRNKLAKRKKFNRAALLKKIRARTLKGKKYWRKRKTKVKKFFKRIFKKKKPR